MKTTILSSLLLGSLLGAAGCTVEENTDYLDGAITATVSLSSSGGGPVGVCQPGDAIRINTRDVNNNIVSDLFNCDDTALFTNTLAGGDYDLWVDYVNDALTPNDATDDFVVGTTDYVAIVVDGNVDIDVPLELDHGFVQGLWTIEDTGGFPVACDEIVGQNGVSILVTETATSDGIDTLLNCSDGGGFSDPQPVGEFVVVFRVLDTDDFTLGQSAPITDVIADGNDYQDVGDVVITLD